jgi:hypothetical protein
VIIFLWIVCFFGVFALAAERHYVKCTKEWAEKYYPDVRFVTTDDDNAVGMLIWLAYETKPVIENVDEYNGVELTADQASEFKATGVYQ